MHFFDAINSPGSRAPLPESYHKLLAQALMKNPKWLRRPKSSFAPLKSDQFDASATSGSGTSTRAGMSAGTEDVRAGPSTSRTRPSGKMGKRGRRSLKALRREEGIVNHSLPPAAQRIDHASILLAATESTTHQNLGSQERRGNGWTYPSRSCSPVSGVGLGGLGPLGVRGGISRSGPVQLRGHVDWDVSPPDPRQLSFEQPGMALGSAIRPHYLFSAKSFRPYAGGEAQRELHRRHDGMGSSGGLTSSPL
jgi:hypothetical protein